MPIEGQPLSLNRPIALTEDTTVPVLERATSGCSEDAILTAGEPLPVYLDKRTVSGPVGVPQTGQHRKNSG